MTLIAKANTTTEYSPIPEGTHIARCVRIIDLGHQYSQQYDKWTAQVRLDFEIPDEMIEIKGEQVPRIIGKTFTNSLGERSNLRKMLESWRGKKFTDEELAGFNLADLAGQPCMVTVAHREYNGRTYADVAALVALPKSIPAPEQVTPFVVFDLDNFEAIEELDNVPEWLADKIKDSKEWLERFAPAAVATEASSEEDLPF